VIAFGGDVNLGRACGQKLLTDSNYDPLRGINRVWADADARFVNLESPLSEQRGETQSPFHALVFTGPPSGADALARANVTLVSTANNHAWDYTKRGLVETLENLERVTILHAGTGRTEDEAYRPLVLQVRGLTITLVALTHVWNLGVFSEEEARHHVAWAEDPRIDTVLRDARKHSDFVIVSYHGGEEYLAAPPTRTRKLVNHLMRLGVDAIIGHHPHVPQGIAWFGARPVLYSLGNLVFDARKDLPWTHSSFIARLRFERGMPVQVEACPYRINGYEPTALGEPDAARAFEDQLLTLSASVGGSEGGGVDAQGCFPVTPRAPVKPRATVSKLARR